MRLCNVEKFSIEFIYFVLDVYELKLWIEKLVLNIIFWILNVKVIDNLGILFVEEIIIFLSFY